MEKERDIKLLSALQDLTKRYDYAKQLGQSYGGDRDTYKAFGYPESNTLKFEHFLGMYERQDIATRIVNLPVQASWRLHPTIKEKKKTFEEVTVFERQWMEIVEKNRIYHYIVRADKISRIGRFGALFLGFDDGKGPENEITGKNSLVYLMPFMEDSINILKWDTDRASKRFNQPLIYEFNVQNSSFLKSDVTNKIKVHYSRVLHFSENLLEGEVFGISALHNIYNRLLDLEKVVGGSSEMFYRGAYPGLAFNLKNDGAFPANIDVGALEDSIEKYIHQLQRYIKLENVEVQNLAPHVANPIYHFRMLLSIVSGAKGIPQRILIGTEEGKLAGNSDENQWLKINDERRRNYCEPFILREFIKKLIFAGALEEPKNGYVVEWPDMVSPTDKDKAEIARTVVEAIATYSNAIGATEIIPVEIFLEKILQLDIDTVERIKELVVVALDDEEKNLKTDESLGEELKKEVEMELKKEAKVEKPVTEK